MYSFILNEGGDIMFIEEIEELIKRQPGVTISYKIQFQDEVFSRCEDKQYRSASTIKVPISIVCLQQNIEDYEDIKLKVGKKVGGSGVMHTLKDMDELSLWDTVVLSNIVSDNSTSNMLMNHVGFEKLKTGFEELGLKNSVAGLNYYDFEAAKNGKRNSASAGDMFRVMKLLKEDSGILPKDMRESFFDVLKSQQFNERVGGYIGIDEENGEYIASKTGTVEGMEHEYGVIYKNGRTLIFSIFTDGWEENQDGVYFLNQMGKIFNKYL